MSHRPDRRRQHHLLYVGYGLIAAVLILMAVTLNGWIDRARLHDETAALDSRIAAFKDDQTAAEKLLAEQATEIRSQNETLQQHRDRIQRQEVALSRLARLRRQDARSLTGLHNELAVRYAGDAEVKQRLQQLEKSNAAARTVINATPATPVESQP